MFCLLHFLLKESGFLIANSSQNKEDGSLLEQLTQNLGKPIPLVVYNSRQQTLRGMIVERDCDLWTPLVDRHAAPIAESIFFTHRAYSSA